MKRALTAALIGLMTFGAVYGLAASLNVASDSLGAGDVTVVTGATAGDRQWDATQAFRVIRTWPLRWGWLAVAALSLRALLEVLTRRPQVIVCGHVLLGPLCRTIRAVFGVPYVAMAYAYEIRAPRMRSIAGVALRGATTVGSGTEIGPMTTLIEAYRALLLGTPGPGIVRLGVVAAAGACLIVIGHRVFVRLAPRFADHL